MPRKTDSKNAADWLWLAESDLGMVRLAEERQTSYHGCRSKLAEVLEKVLKAELIRLGWPLEKTHDLNRLVDELVRLNSPLLGRAVPVAKALAEVYFSDRYPGFDLDDPDWPALGRHLAEVSEVLAAAQSQLSRGGAAPSGSLTT